MERFRLVVGPEAEVVEVDGVAVDGVTGVMVTADADGSRRVVLEYGCYQLDIDATVDRVRHLCPYGNQT